MKIALTGCTGHIGYNICKRLLDEGHQLNLLVRGNSRPFIDKNVEYFKGDLDDKDALRRMMIGVDYVYHLAAKIAISGETEKEVFHVNVHGLQNLLDAYKESSAKRLIHFSSIHAYQQLPRDQELNEDRALVEKSSMVYDRSKSKGQQLVIKFCTDNNLECVILNPTAVFGPEDKFGSNAGDAILDLINGKVPVVMNYGFDWVDVRDIASAAVNAMTKGENCKSYILSGEYLTLKEKAKKIKSVGGKKKSRPTMPIWVMGFSLPIIKVMSKITRKPPLFTREMITTLKEGNMYISSKSAEKDLGFSARPYEDSIRDFIEYFKKEGKLK
jgi:dihydroflavonol-4-reductase